MKLSLWDNTENQSRKDLRLKIHVCSKVRPYFTVVRPDFKVFNAVKPDEETDQVNKIETVDPVDIFLFSFKGDKPKLCNSDDKELPIEDESDGIWRARDMIDPVNYSSGQFDCVCQFKGLTTEICIETIEDERGEFTIEDEIRVQIIGKNENKVRELYDIFNGKSKTSYKLGKTNKASLRRSDFAKKMTTKNGWRPILTDLLDDQNIFPDADPVGEYILSTEKDINHDFEELKLPEESEKLLKKYESIRFNIIEKVSETIDKRIGTQQHPDYAICPIFCKKNCEEIEELLEKYLVTDN